MDTIVLRGTCGQEDDGNNAERRVLAKPAAKIEACAARNHDVEQKKCRWLPLGIGKYLTDRQIRTYGKACGFEMVLHQAGDIRVIFQHKNRLTQFSRPQSGLQLD